MVTQSRSRLALRSPPRSTARAGLTLASGAIALWLEPVAQTLTFGQINLLLMFLVLLDLCQRDDRPWKGVGVGLAAAVKLTPSIFIGYLVLTRRFRAAAVASGTLLAGIAGGFLLLPAASRRFWLDGLFLHAERVGGVPYVANQSINGALVRLFAGHGGAAPSWLVAASIVGLVGLALAAWAGSRGLDLLGVLTCALTALLVSPISWSHHWVWIALLIPCAADLLVGRRWTAAWLALAALTAAFAAGPVRAIWRVPSTGNLEYGWHGAQLVIGNLYVALGLVLLGLTALYLTRTRAG